MICEPGQVPGSNGKEKKTEKYMARVNLQLTKTQRDKQGRDGRRVKQTVMSKWTRHERWKELFLEMLFQMFVAMKSGLWDWNIPTSARVTLYNCTHHFYIVGLKQTCVDNELSSNLSQSNTLK